MIYLFLNVDSNIQIAKMQLIFAIKIFSLNIVMQVQRMHLFYYLSHLTQ